MDLTLGILIAAVVALLVALPIIYSKIEKQKNKKASTKKLFLIRNWIYILACLLFLFTVFREIVGYISKNREKGENENKQLRDSIADILHDKKMDTGFVKTNNKIDTSTFVINGNSDNNRDRIINKIPKTPFVIKNDTIPKVRVTGNNNHTVVGTNNGINGDVLVNTEIKLTDHDKSNLIYLITDAKQKFNITSDSIMMRLWIGGNSKLYYQINDFLISRGFKTILFTAAGREDGVNVWHEGNMIRVSVGVY